jgi:hypothetical protein
MNRDLILRVQALQAQLRECRTEEAVDEAEAVLRVLREEERFERFVRRASARRRQASA